VAAGGTGHAKVASTHVRVVIARHLRESLQAAPTEGVTALQRVGVAEGGEADGAAQALAPVLQGLCLHVDLYLADIGVVFFPLLLLILFFFLLF